MTPTRQEIIELARAVDIVPGIGDVVNGKYRPHKNALGKSVPVEWLQGFAKLLLERFGTGGGEPVAWIDGTDLELMRKDGRGCIAWGAQKHSNATTPLYIHPSPTDLRAEYLRGLEDAAEVCEAEWSNVAEKMYGKECADAIRALKGKP